MQQLFRQMVPSGGEPISIDRLMADLEKSKAPVHTAPVKNDPPQVFYSDKPAILLMVEEKPVLAPIEKTDLQFVVNTNWNLIFDKDKKIGYVRITSFIQNTTDDLKKALTELKAALKLVPDNADLQFTVGNAMVAIGYPGEAIIPLQRVDGLREHPRQ